jgi:glycopeptide antibiotics resistance protein
MVRSKLSVIVALIYAFAIACALLFPKTVQEVSSTENFLFRLLHKILFISGPLEVIGNFLLFIPVLLALIHASPTVRLRYMALICCLGSASAELAQSWIPGRVSSLRDFISNSFGVVLILVLMKKYSRFTLWVKGI